MIRSVHYYRFECDDCHKIRTVDTHKEAREKGWSISRGRLKCYCPECSPFHRSVGSAGAPIRSQKDIDFSSYGYTFL